MNSAVKTAYLLVSHGSRDPRSLTGAEQLAQQLRQRLGLGDLGLVDRPRSSDAQGEVIVAIATAVLELGPAPLHLQIGQFAREVAPLGVTRLKLLPLFLLPGVHVREDLPEELRLAQADAPPGLALELLPHLGEGQALLPVLKAQQASLCQQLAGTGDRRPVLANVSGGNVAGRESGPLEPACLPVEQIDWVLLAHGSRRPAAGQAIERLARSIGATPAYWVGSPRLEDCLAERGAAGGAIAHRRPLGILSYFLFEGGITDRLQGTLQTSGLDFPMAMSAHLGAFSALTTVAAKAMVTPRLT